MMHLTALGKLCWCQSHSVPVCDTSTVIPNCAGFISKPSWKTRGNIWYHLINSNKHKTSVICGIDNHLVSIHVLFIMLVGMADVSVSSNIASITSACCIRLIRIKGFNGSPSNAETQLACMQIISLIISKAVRYLYDNTYTWNTLTLHTQFSHFQRTVPLIHHPQYPHRTSITP